MGSVRGTTKSNGRKDALDRFYTSADVAVALVGALGEMGLVNKDTVFCEPSAGAGSFVKAIEDTFPENIIEAYDIAPADKPACKTKIETCDFLEKKIAYDSNRLIVGNPPFGEQAALCFAFIAKSFEIAPLVSFILPLSFKKESFRKKIGHDPIKVVDLASTIYKVGDDDIDVPSAFFVFSKDHIHKADVVDFSQLPFEFTKDASAADFAIQRVGGNAGRATARLDVSKESNYFCKITDSAYDAAKAIELVNSSVFEERDWTAGPRSISKKELARSILKSMGKTV